MNIFKCWPLVRMAGPIYLAALVVPVGSCPKLSETKQRRVFLLTQLFLVRRSTLPGAG